MIHVHTRRSDGAGTIDDVAAAAARAGLQFVILSDHGDGTGMREPPSYRSGVLCIDAVEIRTSGAPDETRDRRWRRSVYLDDMEQTITVFLDEMTPVGDRSGSWSCRPYVTSSSWSIR